VPATSRRTLSNNHKPGQLDRSTVDVKSATGFSQVKECEMMNKFGAIAGALILSGSALVGVGRAAVIANFADGAGNASVDQFPGVAGNGWLTEWQMDTLGSTGTVETTTPLNGGGNYLSVTAPQPGGGTSNRWVRRSVGDFEDLVLNLPHVIEFDFRPDIPLSGGDINNRFHLFGATGAGTNTSNSSTWIAMAASGPTAGDTPIDFVAGNWGFLRGVNGGTASFPGMTFIDTGIAMTAGTVYHFKLEIDPPNRSYKPSLSDGVTSFVSQDFLSYRQQGNGISAVVSPWMHFAKRFTADNLSPSIGFSVDNITISVPSTAQPGDFDGDGDVDGADFVAWQTNFPKATGATLAEGDADGDGDVDGADFVVWQTNFPFTPGPGAAPVPEPATMLVGLAGLAGLMLLRRMRS
jgi:hypothetical protein